MSSDHALFSLLRILSATTLLLGLVLVPFILFGEAVEARSHLAFAQSPEVLALGGAALLALDVLLPVPSSIVATAMGAALGAWPGTLVNAVGLTSGCLLGLMVGRSGSPLVQRLLGKRLYPGFVAWVERYGIAAVLVCRAVPVLAEASVIALGAARARPGPILLAAAAADLGLGAVYAFAGAAHGPAAAPGLPAFAAAIGLPAFAAVAVLFWIRKARTA
jgi:uncharacterized membrane protein YdjX (TVP38/TMEM64 family)